MSADIPNPYHHLEELPYPQEYAYPLTEERSYMFLEDEMEEPYSWYTNVLEGVEQRIGANVDRQAVAGPQPFDIRQAIANPIAQTLSQAIFFGLISVIILHAIIKQPLQSHPRCGITTGGQV